MQRIPRYKLLLEQLLKETPQGHPDHKSTLEALDEVAAVATKVNAAIKRREAVEKVYELRAEFASGGGELVRPGRYFLRRAELTVHFHTLDGGGASVAETERDKDKAVTLILFNDALLIAEKTFSGKLAAVSWWLPEDIECIDHHHNRAQASMGSLLRLRQGLEELSFVPGDDELGGWVEDLKHLPPPRSQALARGNSHFVMGSPSMHGSGRRGIAAGASLVRTSSGVPPQPPRSKSSFLRGGSSKQAVGADITPGIVGGAGLIAGWLQKKGGGGADGGQRNWTKGGRRNWKWRWVIVTSDQCVMWYESEKKRELKGSLALNGAQVAASPTQERPGGFWVLTNNRSLQMAAESAAVAERWIAVLQEAANMLTSSVKERSIKHIDGAEDRPTAHAGGGGSEGGGDDNNDGSCDEGDGPGSHQALPGGGRELQRPEPPAADENLRVRALYAYEAGAEGQLSLSVGDVIRVYDRGAESDGWWFGSIERATDSPRSRGPSEGRSGYFPVAYVAPVEETAPQLGSLQSTCL